LFRILLFFLDKLHLLLAGFLFVALIIPHEKWNNLYSTVAMVALLLLYFLRTIKEGRIGFPTGAFNVYLVFYIFCVLLGEIFSIMPMSSLRFLAFYLTCFILVLLLISTIRNKKDLDGVLALLLVGLSIAGLYGIYQKIVGVPVNPAWVDTTVNAGDMTRIYSFFYNPNNFAEIIILFIPFYFAAAFNTKNGLLKLIYLGLAVPPFLSLLLTQSRSCWLAFAFAGLVYVFFKEKRLIPVFILLGIAAIPFLPQSIVLRIRTITNPSDSSAATRLDVWQTVLPILKDYWFTGLGLGNETLLTVLKNYHIFAAKGIPSHSHDLYLQVWFETGFPGLLAFFAFIGATVKKSIRSLYSRVKDAYTSNVLIAGLAALAGILVVGFVEYVWFYQRVMLFFWAVIGIMLAALNIGAKETGSAAENVDSGDSAAGGCGKKAEPGRDGSAVAVSEQVANL
jgi:O-antigen ligase